MKYEWKKQARELYLPKRTPEIVTVPSMKFFMLDGMGNPNSEDFADSIGVLYTLSYAVKMMPKKGITPEGYFEYTVFPLEGVWDLAPEARGAEVLDKDSLVYTIMIRQPDFVTEDTVKAALTSAAGKLKSPTKAALFLDVSGVWAIGIPMAVLGGLVFHFPIYIVYAMVMIEEVYKVILGYIRYRQNKWLKNIVN